MQNYFTFSTTSISIGSRLGMIPRWWDTAVKPGQVNGRRAHNPPSKYQRCSGLSERMDNCHFLSVPSLRRIS
jgi:hypothetical protein